MVNLHCPGQDTRYWTPEHIYEANCLQCGKPVEFFKDDVRRICPHCGEYTLNPLHDMACAAWCACAPECLALLGRENPNSNEQRPVSPVK